MCWIESELYGPYIVKQILDGNHVKRGEKAHMITLQAWFALYLDGFPENLPDLRQCLENLSREVIEAFREGKKEKIERAHPSSEASVPRKSLKRFWSSALQTTEALCL